VNEYRAVRATIRQIYAELDRASRTAAVDLEAIQAQVAALCQVMAAAQPARPDANGWIARPTLR
jgi:hypothetical protein